MTPILPSLHQGVPSPSPLLQTRTATHPHEVAPHWVKVQLTWGAAAGGPHGALHRSSSSPLVSTTVTSTVAPALGGPEDSAPGGSGTFPLPGSGGDAAPSQLQPSTSEGAPPPSSVARYPPPPHPAAAGAYWASDLGRRRLEEELQAVLDVQQQQAVQQAGRGTAAGIRQHPSRRVTVRPLLLRLEHMAPLFDGSGASLLLEVVFDISGAGAHGAAVLPGGPPRGEASTGAFPRIGGRGFSAGATEVHPAGEQIPPPLPLLRYDRPTMWPRHYGSTRRLPLPLPHSRLTSRRLGICESDGGILLPRGGLNAFMSKHPRRNGWSSSPQGVATTELEHPLQSMQQCGAACPPAHERMHVAFAHPPSAAPLPLPPPTPTQERPPSGG